MEIDFVSDLHLEFAPLELPGGDVLVVAGDVGEIRNIIRDLEGILINNKPRNMVFKDFFEVQCAKYRLVIYVMGNHEYYHSLYNTAVQKLKSLLPSNVIILDDESLEVDGVLFLGSTLWTDMNRGDPITKMTVQNGMNDFRTIKYQDRDGRYRKFLVNDAVEKHHRSVRFLAEALAENRDKECVVVTHHAPCSLSVAEAYAGAYHMNGGYFSDLSGLILDNTNIKLWCHGHMHNRSDYKVGETRVIANPRGYVGHEPTTETFNPKTNIVLGC